MKSKIFFTSIILFISINILAQESKHDEKNEIIKTLNEFKKGYAERDTSKAKEWCSNLFFDNVEIIGTYSISPNSNEWFKGIDKAIRVFKSDWIAWGDFDANIATANIDYDGNLAWVSFEATITRSPENSRSRTSEASSGNIFTHFKNIAEKEDGRSNKLKLMEAAYYANLILYQYEQGEEFIWPIRITAVLQKKDNTWKFRQIHFSHPNRGFPNVRNSNN